MKSRRSFLQWFLTAIGAVVTYPLIPVQKFTNWAWAGNEQERRAITIRLILEIIGGILSIHGLITIAPDIKSWVEGIPSRLLNMIDDFNTKEISEESIECHVSWIDGNSSVVESHWNVKHKTCRKVHFRLEPLNNGNLITEISDSPIEIFYEISNIELFHTINSKNVKSYKVYRASSTNKLAEKIWDDIGGEVEFATPKNDPKHGHDDLGTLGFVVHE